MSTPESNAQFVNSLFSPAAAQIQRMNSQRLALAETGMRRAWQLNDAQARREQDLADFAAARAASESAANTQFERAKELVTLRTKGDIEVETEKAKKTNAATKEATDRATDAARRKAYAEYVMLEGNEPPESFGEGEDAIEKIIAASGKLKTRALKAKLSIGSDFIKSRAAELRSLINEGEIESQARNMAASSLSQMASGDIDKALPYLSSDKKGDESIGLKFLSPEDQATYSGLKQQAALSLRTQKFKDPYYLDRIKAMRDAEEWQMKTVREAGGIGENALRDLSSSLIGVDSALGIKKEQTAPDFSKYFSTDTKPQASAATPPQVTAPTGPMFSYPALSIAGQGERVASAASTALPALRRMTADPVASTLDIAGVLPRYVIDRPVSAISRGFGTGDWSAQAGFGEIAGNKIGDGIIAAQDAVEASLPALRTAGSVAGRSFKDYLLRALINRNAAEEPTTP